MREHASIVKVGPLVFLAVIFTVCVCSPVESARADSKAYFSSGQAVFDPQNQAKSRQQAIKDFMTRGLIQAIASFLDPDQMGAQFDKLQKSVLAGPQKYVNTYQLFSEKQIGGEFQVVGKVTVSMDILKKDLEKLGAVGSKNPPAPPLPATPPAAAAPPPAAALAPRPAAGSTGQPAREKKPQPPVSPPVAVTPAGPGPNVAAPASRGIRPTKKEVLWAVVEKWDEKWLLPTDSGDIRCIFARSIAKEMDGFGFSILLAQPGAVEMDNDGNIPPYQAVSLAGELGVKNVVVGKVSYIVDRQNREVSLQADLRVIRSGKGQTGVQIRKTLSMEDLSNQAGALELARRIAPRLSGLLGGPEALVESGGPGSAQFPAHLGKLVLHLGSLQYPHWSELETILRRQFQDMHVDDLQIGPTETVITLDKVDGGYLLKLNGTRLPSGVALQIDSYSTQAATMNISFVSPVKVQAQPK
ncbi:MAG: hypothetical protein P4L43_09325 [Syntrophobacteraceae bacterium]|nr:hypothetical protein [Syntrophobacteraceae bacterium]